MKNKYVLNRGGFTLVEILFVLLVIALIINFAMPAIRAVRLDAKNSQAKAALKKIAEARRSYYQKNKGYDVTGDFSWNMVDLSQAPRQYAGHACSNVAASGIPASAAASAGLSNGVDQLFACGFLNWRDFADLPYIFYVCPIDGSGSAPCNVPGRYAAAKGTADAGKKYNNESDYVMFIDQNMKVEDNED